MHLIEKLTAQDPAGKWIEDFTKSDDPKFSGKSKAERKKMALGAFYAKVKESVDLLEYTIEKMKTGVRVVHGGETVHTAKDATRAQQWIASQMDESVMKNSQVSIKESFIDAALNQDFLESEKQFKEIMSQKAAQYMDSRKKEIAQDFYKE